MKSSPTRHYRITTFFGTFRAAFSDAGLCALSLPDRPSKLLKRGSRVPPGVKQPPFEALPELNGDEGALGKRVKDALHKRLDGRRADLPWAAFDLHGRSDFFVRAWQALYAIPFGAVRSYGDIAKAAGSPKAVRAAGQACGANPIVLFIPCHRVVASNGPGGFGGGLEWKAKLLKLEGFELEA